MTFETQRKGTAVILSIGDSVEWDDARLIDAAVKEFLSGGCCDVAFDLSKVTYICSAGIGALVYNLEAAKKNGGAIYIVSSSEYIDYLFQTLNFDRVFSGKMFKTVNEFESMISGRKKA
jgi:anti-anti-sigma factor